MSEGHSGPTKPPAGHNIPKEVPKPFTTPEGYVAPSMQELWLHVRPQRSAERHKLKNSHKVLESTK